LWSRLVTSAELFKTLEPEKLEMIKKDVIESYEVKCGKDALNPDHFELLVLIAQKP
jgi:hypothetical protein